MAQLEPLAAEFRGKGVQLAYIAAEKRGGMFKPEEYLQRNPVSFPFLLDEDRSVTKAYGLYHRIGLDAFNIAHPATLVVDLSKMIRYLYRGGNQLDRAPLEQVTEAVERMRKK
jgi:peroxiredoxin